MFHSLISSWTLFFGLAMIMIGNGLQLVLLGLRADQAGYSTLMTGVMMGGYFLGLFLGSLAVPKFLSRVGHIRIFGALASLASAAVLLHLVLEQPLIWALMRLVTGLSYAGMYIVVESWLNEKSTNETRGQMLSVYMIITWGGMGLGQLLAGSDDGQSAMLFLLASVLVSLAVVPILLSAAKAPDFSEPERISLRRLWQISPLAMAGMFLQGLSVAMLFGMGPSFGRQIGLSAAEVSVFIASATVGVLLLQYPLGRLSDRTDRRLLILGSSVVAFVIAGLAVLASGASFYLLLLFMTLYGGLNLTLYSMFIAHANDYLTPRQMVSTASALLMVNGIGAVLGSPLVAMMMELFGTLAYFAMLGFSNLLLIGFVLVRIRARAAVPTEAQGPLVAFPEAGTAVAASLNPEAAWLEAENSPADEDALADNPYLSQ
jgi:MFS family permease